MSNQQHTSVLKLINITSLASIFIFCSCNQQKGHWDGTIEVTDGAKIVRNPIEPMYSEKVVSFVEDLSVGDAYGPEQYMFTNLQSLEVDDEGNIYALDGIEKHIKVFDDTGFFLTTIGRFGQGPGEIGFPENMSITAQNEIMILDRMNHRLMFFSPEGELTRNVLLRSLSLLKAKNDSYGNIIGLTLLQEEENPRHELQKFDTNLEYLYSFDSSPLPDHRKLNPFSPSLRWDIDKDNRIICGYPVTYEIKIFSEDGELEKKIMKDCKPLEITKEDIKRFEGIPPGIKLIIPKFYPAFLNFIIDDERRIFVMTYEKVPDSEKRYFDVFDREGKYIAKIPLGFGTQIIKKNKLYAIEKNNDGYDYIKRYQVNWKI